MSSENSEIMTLKIADIVRIADYQSRESMTQEAVDYYAELLGAGVDLPPVDVVKTSDGMMLYDGWHRLAAHEKVGRSRINATVIDGTPSDVPWLAAQANKAHGVQRSRADRRRAVHLALQCVRSEKMSNRALAAELGVSEGLVRSVKGELEGGKEAEEEQGTDAEAASEPQVTEDRGEPSPPLAPSMAVESKPEPDPEPDDGEDRSIEYLKRKTNEDIMALRAMASKYLELEFPVRDQLEADFENIVTSLRLYARPAGVCPYCDGDGCKECGKRGWLGEVEMEAVPDEETA